MKVSVVIPSFNDIRVLETIESIYSQNYDKSLVEIIIQDGGSGSSVLSAIRDALGPLDTLVVEADEGIFDGINRGLKNSNGDIILTLGTDDRISDRDLFTKVRELYDQGFNFIQCGLCYTDSDWRVIRKWPARSFTYVNYLLGRQFAHFSLFCTPDLYRKIGYFNDNNPVNADFEFFHKALKGKRSFLLKSSSIPSYSIQMKIGGNSSRNIGKILASNFLMFRYVLKNDPLLLGGLCLKPIHKGVEFLRAKLH
jgi:glycosyltransferase involved in cell wall biosynthesis